MRLFDHWKGRRDAGRYSDKESISPPFVVFRAKQRDYKSRKFSTKFNRDSERIRMDIANLQALVKFKKDDEVDLPVYCELQRLNEELATKANIKATNIAKRTDIAERSSAAYQDGWMSALKDTSNTKPDPDMFKVPMYKEAYNGKAHDNNGKEGKRYEA